MDNNNAPANRLFVPKLSANSLVITIILSFMGCFVKYCYIFYKNLFCFCKILFIFAFEM